jgi:hypothetical protein
MAYFGESQVGDETVELLRDAPSRTLHNYQTYQDLSHRALGSLQLLTVSSPILSSPQPRRFRGNIYFPIEIFKLLNEYLDRPSRNSFRCASKSIKSGLDISRTYDPARNQPSFRIDPTQVLNRLRGIPSDITAPRYNSLGEENDPERISEATTQREGDDQSHITQTPRFAYAVLIFIFFGVVYTFIRILCVSHSKQNGPER